MRAEEDRNGKATIRDIAALAGVSIATVSRVMNGRPDVSPSTREAVLSVIRSHDFTGNRSARALSSGRTGLIAFTIPIVHSEYFSLILSGASEALYEHDMRFVLCPTRHQHDREVKLLDRLLHGTTDAAIFLLPEETSEELSSLYASGYPLVVIDPREPLDPGIPAVAASHAAGARAIMEHLLGLGHTKIAAITGPSSWLASQERLSGYAVALATRGLLPQDRYIRQGTFLEDSGYRAAADLLDQSDPPTAIFCFNDNMAVGAMRAARERGLDLPADLSIAGFDDSIMSPVTHPALTTARQPLEEMGRVAVSLLSRLISGRRLEALRIDLATQLVVRDSTAAPGAARTAPMQRRASAG
jgi:LacI family transcriptional regulator